ncbi:MAG: hypothetical protein WCA94_13385 [Candidatus Acidiferrum sp.]
MPVATKPTPTAASIDYNSKGIQIGRKGARYEENSGSNYDASDNRNHGEEIQLPLQRVL